MFEPKQMRQKIRNWAQVKPRLLARLRREAAGDPLSPSWSLLREFALGNDRGESPGEDVEALTPVVRLEITIGGLGVDALQYDHDFRHTTGYRPARIAH